MQKAPSVRRGLLAQDTPIGSNDTGEKETERSDQVFISMMSGSCFPTLSDRCHISVIFIGDIHLCPGFNLKNLLEEAKKTGNKNKINWKVRKHSGQTFGAMIDKNDPEELNKSVDLINASLGRDSLFLHSVTYWLDSQLEMLSYILENEDADFRQQALQNFMNNNFNEGIHGNYESFLLRAQEYLLHFEKGSGLRKLHVLLRYITLLIKKNDYE